MKLVFVLLVILTLDSAEGEKIEYTNLCGTSSCKCKRHIDCDNYNELFSRNCTRGSIIFGMTEKLKYAILQKHNQFRNQVAGGSLPGFAPASRMGTVKWDEHLANLARKNLKMCKFQRDKCRNTEEFHYVGQSMGRYIYPNYRHKPEDMMMHIIDIWMSEFTNCKMSYIYKHPQGSEIGAVIRHFTITVREALTAMGCAAIMYMKNDLSYFEFLCNYSQTNLRDLPVYTVGKSGSRCKTGRHKLYPNLCKVGELYNINPKDAVEADCVCE